MAEALGWGMDKRPAFTVATGAETGGADTSCLGGSGARRGLIAAKSLGDWVLRTNQGNPEDGYYTRSVEASAPTLNGVGRSWAWQLRNDAERRSMSIEHGAIRLETHGALTLQSFRSDYPLRGSRTSQFLQVGNAVPPVLAGAVVGQLAR